MTVDGPPFGVEAGVGRHRVGSILGVVHLGISGLRLEGAAGQQEQQAGG